MLHSLPIVIHVFYHVFYLPSFYPSFPHRFSVFASALFPLLSEYPRLSLLFPNPYQFLIFSFYNPHYLHTRALFFLNILNLSSLPSSLLLLLPPLHLILSIRHLHLLSLFFSSFFFYLHIFVSYVSASFAPLLLCL